jgi:hypothetical protein
MKKLILAFVSVFLFNSCGVPFKIESSNGSFSRNTDGSVFFGYKSKAPVVIDEK